MHRQLDNLRDLQKVCTGALSARSLYNKPLGDTELQHAPWTMVNGAPTSWTYEGKDKNKDNDTAN
eukprot:6181551-Pleurochrysis_carterae.AAC.2